VLQTADREIDLLKQKLAALQRQKKGLMQKLLTGQVRVRVTEKS
jgi:type I restriction enzyme S subunit